MKERQILFSAPMVRALLAGTKTQTRRLINPQPRPWTTNPAFLVWRTDEPIVRLHLDSRSPYGAPGDRLWVRETWYDDQDRKPGEAHELNIDRFDDGRVEGVEYRASHNCAAWEAGCPCNPDGDGKRSAWRPSIYMPRWASRITLEVTDVRAERLQMISEEDAKAEGIHKPFGSQFWHSDVGKQLPGETPQWAFRNLWESINGDRAPWDSNPWVWRVSFRRLAP